ncbi:MAG: PEGA domain-containing protein [Melioribacteraceae bacterium]|nr:PEGA domain-containing protein [Melioribacteraceae bacterium]
MKTFLNKILFLLFLVFITAVTSCDEELSSTKPEGRVHNGMIFVDSNPHGIQIYLNEINTGYFTPDTLKWLQDGLYVITLKNELLRDTFIVLSAIDGEVQELFVDYYSNPKMRGKISCLSVPEGADIYLNDEFTGKITPDTLVDLFPMEYKIKFVKENHRSDSLISTVLSNKITHAVLTLADTSLWVDYHSGNSGMSSNFISTIEFDKNNNLWIGTQDKGFIYYDYENWLTFSPSNSILPSERIQKIISNGDEIWVGTTAGIVKIINDSWELITKTNSPLLSDYIEDIEVDLNGVFWIATDNGLASYNSGTWHLYFPDNSQIPGRYITSIAVDGFNKKWIGTLDNGIAMFDGNNFTIYSEDNGALVNNKIQDISIRENGEIWAAHVPIQNKTENVSYFSSGQWRVPNFDSQLKKVNRIICDELNYVWLLTEGGIFVNKFSGAVTLYNKENSRIIVNNISDASRDKAGYIWFAELGGGIVKFKGSK